VLEYQESNPDVWSMKSHELRDACREIAHAPREEVQDSLRTEANQLAIEWDEALGLPQLDPFDASRRASIVAALRKRTIEILIKLEGNR